MTERERIEADIKERNLVIVGCRASIQRMEVEIMRQSDRLAALPPDKPDLSAWGPGENDEFYFADSLGNVIKAGARYSRSVNYGCYQTRAEAERAAKRQKLHTRLWQCWERMYGGVGFQTEGDFVYGIWTNKKGDPCVKTSVLEQKGSPSFKTEQHAQWVIEQLQSEGLL
jgi:hypothetical protein